MTESRRRVLPGYLLGGGLSLVTIVGTLALVELGLVLSAPVPFSIERDMYYEPDPWTGFRLRPNGRGHYWGRIPANANAQGLRDEPVEIPKPVGTFRILALGDSFTVGAHVEQEQAYPEVLERLLAEASDRPVEVVNAGVSGWAPFQYRQYYEHRGFEFQPDLILVGFFVGNDAYCQHVLEENVAEIVDIARAARESRVVVAFLPDEVQISAELRHALLGKENDSQIRLRPPAVRSGRDVPAERGRDDRPAARVPRGPARPLYERRSLDP